MRIPQAFCVTLQEATHGSEPQITRVMHMAAGVVSDWSILQPSFFCQNRPQRHNSAGWRMPSVSYGPGEAWSAQVRPKALRSRPTSHLFSSSVLGKILPLIGRLVQRCIVIPSQTFSGISGRHERKRNSMANTEQIFLCFYDSKISRRAGKLTR